MGLTLSKLIYTVFAKKEVKLLLFGLAGAGKTSLLLKIQPHMRIESPTMGINIEKCEYKNITFVSWNFVNTRFRRYANWNRLYRGFHGLIFVVDAADKENMELAQEEFQALINAELLKVLPLLVFAKKQDLDST